MYDIPANGKKKTITINRESIVEKFPQTRQLDQHAA
jgi:hypothetical protein